MHPHRFPTCPASYSGALCSHRLGLHPHFLNIYLLSVCIGKLSSSVFWDNKADRALCLTFVPRAQISHNKKYPF